MSGLKRRVTLTAQQKDMYAQEKFPNFRLISKIVASKSRRLLMSEDLVSLEVHEELSEIGQYTEIASSRSLLPIRFLFDNIDTLLKKDFPLEGYSALRNARFFSEFHGSIANLQAFIAYRPELKQLILSFSGTTTLTQAMFDIKTNLHYLSSGHGAAHAGFWGIYKGVRGAAHQGLREAFQPKEGEEKLDIEEVVVTGHSLGGAISYLFMMDLLSGKDCSTYLPAGTRLKLAAFGAPRPGNVKLTQYWRSLVSEYRTKHGGDHKFVEYSVKAYNDGVPSLPPSSFGFRHFTPRPMYCHNGLMYLVPEEFCEDSLFAVKEDFPADSKWSLVQFPKGGHNYYNGRNMEKASRRILWLDKIKAGTDGWEKRYLERLERKKAKLKAAKEEEGIPPKEAAKAAEEEVLDTSSPSLASALQGPSPSSSQSDSKILSATSSGSLSVP